MIITFSFIFIDLSELKKKLSGYNMSDCCYCCDKEEIDIKKERKVIPYNNNGYRLKETEKNKVNIENVKNNENDIETNINQV